MDAKILYWTGALINFGVVCTLALIGVKRIRAKDIQGHRRMMLTSSALVFGFIASYVLKVIFLGKENRKVWDTFSLWSLHIHESWILVMILAGGYAGYRAWTFRNSLPTTGLLEDRLSPVASRRHHRTAGWIAVVGSLCAFATASLVLYGMYARA
jgi:uncharacterized membrane protein YozB (DUF420 family)